MHGPEQPTALKDLSILWPTQCPCANRADFGEAGHMPGCSYFAAYNRLSNTLSQSSGNLGELEALRAERDALKARVVDLEAKLEWHQRNTESCTNDSALLAAEHRNAELSARVETLTTTLKLAVEAIAAHVERVKRETAEQCARVFCSEIEWHAPELTEQHFVELFYRAAGIEEDTK